MNNLYNQFIIYDIPEEKINKKDENYYFSSLTKYAYCLGCFDCWLKTPGKCIMKDKVYGLSDIINESKELVIVSKNLYGGFSKETKGVVDRLIAFNLPFFKKLDNELHHKPRYDNMIDLKVVFYGDINEEEKECASNYVASIAKNFNAKSYNTIFTSKDKVGEVL